MRGFGLTIEPLAGGAVRVALRGELDLEHAYTFDEELRRVEAGRPGWCSTCARSRSSTRAGSRGCSRRATGRAAGRRLLLIRGGPAMQRLMAITAVSEHFEMVREVPPELLPAGGLASQA